MTIQQLRVFLVTCEEMNYTRAAERCFISRQALRQNVAALEEELCGPLFESRDNRLSLTPKGELLRQEAGPAVEAFRQLEEKMAAETERSRTLRLGISYALVPNYLPMLDKLLERFPLDYKGTGLETVNLNNRDIAPAIVCGELDCGLVMDLRGCAPGVGRTELTAHPAGILIAEGNPFYGREEIEPRELEGQRFCAPGNGPEFEPLTRDAEIRILEIPSYYQAYYMIRQEGIAALDRCWDGDEDDRFVRMVRLKGLTLCSSFLCREGDNTAGVQHLRDFLRAGIRRAFARMDGIAGDSGKSK